MRLSSFSRELEAAFYTALIFSSGLLFRPADPLFLDVGFPWVWIVPVSIALRYGRQAAAVSLITVLLIMCFLLFTTSLSFDACRIWFLGGAILTWVCAEYQSYWVQKQYSLKKKVQYLDARMESLTRSHQLLNLSYQRLEQAFVVKPATLREAFADLRLLLLSARGDWKRGIVKKLLEIVAFYSSLESAAIYAYEEGKWEMAPLAAIGKPAEFSLDDKLFKRAIEEKQLSYLAVNTLKPNEVSRYLVVAPLWTAESKLLGVLIVTHMPFLALHEEMLKVLGILLSYFADDIAAAQQAVRIQERYPDCSSFFGSELTKMFRLHKEAGIDSSVIVYYFPKHPQRQDIIFLIQKNKRALDVVWQTVCEDEILFYILLPLTERNMLQGYLDRLHTILKENFVGIEGLYIRQHRQISAYYDPLELLNDLFMKIDLTERK